MSYDLSLPPFSTRAVGKDHTVRIHEDVEPAEWVGDGVQAGVDIGLEGTSIASAMALPPVLAICAATL
ncbi:MAG TPA: hypothetical protein VGM27_34670 [Acidobacteriaceae bacterium]